MTDSRHRGNANGTARRILATVAAVAVAACTSSPHPAPKPLAPSASAGPRAPLFYTKAGSLYVSDTAGAATHKLTDGPADTEPAPSPDLYHVAYIRKASGTDYGGELWVLDLSPAHTPVGAPRRLIDPGGLPPMFSDPEFGASPRRVVSPRWSPTGNRIAFLGAGEGGGLLLVADAGSGQLVPHKQRMFADDKYAWAPDGQHIAWIGGRSDVSPVDINVLTVGATSRPVATGTNAFSVTYDVAGRTIWFTNSNASGELFDGIPFALRTGGIYSIATTGGAPANPSEPLVTGRQGSFGDIAALASGAVAFTESTAYGSPETIQVLDTHSAVARTIVGNVAADSPGPAWGPGDVVAYVDSDKHLVVTDVGNRSPKQVDSAVETFAWPPAK